MCRLRLEWHCEEEEGNGGGEEPKLSGASHEYFYQKPALPKIVAPRERPSSESLRRSPWDEDYPQSATSHGGEDGELIALG